MDGSLRYKFSEKVGNGFNLLLLLFTKSVTSFVSTLIHLKYTNI